MEIITKIIIPLLGGLGLFLYGMNLMSDGLERVAGAKLEKTLEKLTGNLFMGVIMGALVTAVIQSSSATTVMVVGFVNAGIMKLSQAVGVIMGANIGTTVTAQILRLNEIKGGGNAILDILKPSTLAPVAIGVGMIIFMMAKKKKIKDIALIILGFGILFFGMSTMSDAVEPLGEMQWFKDALVAFENPIIGIIVGCLFTALIQSSSASVGILQAMAMTGTLKYAVAIPIILGQNIGTCVTAILSAFGATKNAKRASMIHLYFNVIGSVVAIILYFLVQGFIYDFLQSSITSGGIADFHLVFNIVNTILLLPFYKVLLFLAEKSIPAAKDEKQIQTTLLDERFLTTPSLALHQCKKVTIQMGQLCMENLRYIKGNFNNLTDKIITSLEENETAVDKMEYTVSNYITKLTDVELNDKDSRRSTAILHTIGDYERIGDYIENIKETAIKLKENKTSFTPEGEKELGIMFNAVDNILDITLSSYVNKDIILAKEVEPLEEVIDLLTDTLKSRHIERLQNGKCSVDLGIYFIDILTNLERISDHCSAIAINTLKEYDDSMDYNNHEYLTKTHEGITKDYRDNFSKYQEMYFTPVK
ncbi:MAG: Na/Pi cotransporter family protein [Clostridia bacterium]|nr:Na/Pi cotransporter family protein [Clostridia bacterium]